MVTEDSEEKINDWLLYLQRYARRHPDEEYVPNRRPPHTKCECCQGKGSGHFCMSYHILNRLPVNMGYENSKLGLQGRLRMREDDRPCPPWYWPKPMPEKRRKLVRALIKDIDETPQLWDLRKAKQLREEEEMAGTEEEMVASEEEEMVGSEEEMVASEQEEMIGSEEEKDMSGSEEEAVPGSEDEEEEMVVMEKKDEALERLKARRRELLKLAKGKGREE